MSFVPMSSTSIKLGRRKRIAQQIPEQYGEPVPSDHESGKIFSFPVLGGLHHDDREMRLISDMCTKSG